MSDNVIHLPPIRTQPKPDEWDELFHVSVACNGQIFVTCESLDFPEPLVFSLSDICARLIEYSYPKS